MDVNTNSTTPGKQIHPKQLEKNLLPVRDVTLMKYAFF